MWLRATPFGCRICSLKRCVLPSVMRFLASLMVIVSDPIFWVTSALTGCNVNSSYIKGIIQRKKKKKTNGALFVVLMIPN